MVRKVYLNKAILKKEKENSFTHNLGQKELQSESGGFLAGLEQFLNLPSRRNSLFQGRQLSKLISTKLT